MGPVTAPNPHLGKTALSPMLVKDLDSLLAPLADAGRAQGAKAYLKSSLLHLGVDAAGVRAVAKQVLERHPSLTNDQLLAFVGDAFCPPDGQVSVYEHRAVAVGMLERRVRSLEPRHLDSIVLMFPVAATWALVDWISTKVVGPVLLRHPDPKGLLESWASHPDIWVRRASLLSPLDHLRSGKGDLTLFFGIAERLIDEKSFWIQKAIGWVLRDCSRKRPREIRLFAERLGPRLQGLARREALRNLPPEPNHEAGS
jgi:3-methyladenine DNA glycosylase AlkD